MTINISADTQEDLEEEYANQISFNIIRYGPRFDILTLNMSRHPLFSNFAFLNNQRLLDLIRSKVLDSFRVDEDRRDNNEIQQEDQNALNLFEIFKSYNQRRYNNREDINTNLRRPRSEVIAPNQQVMFRQRRAIGPSSRTPSPMIVRNNREPRPQQRPQPRQREERRVAPLQLDLISELDLAVLPDQVEQTITCPISLKIMSDPVINSQGNTYNRDVIEEYIKKEMDEGKRIIDPCINEDMENSILIKDPLNRQPITNKLIPNMVVRTLIQLYFPNIALGGGGRRKLKTKVKRRKVKKNKSKKNKKKQKRSKNL